MPYEFDILTASFHRPESLERLLKSIVDNKPNKLKKIYLLVLETDIATREVVKFFESQLPVKLLEIGEIPFPGRARNMLIAHSDADYLCFIDDDAWCSRDYFLHSKKLMDQDIPIFGGPDQASDILDEKQLIMGELLSSPLVMGPTFKRHSITTLANKNAKESELTLCNLWMKRSVLEENKLRFNENLKRCEENQLLEELSSLGYHFYYEPRLYVHHLRRENWINIARIQFLSGYYRSACFYMHKNNFKWYFIFPFFTGMVLTASFIVPNAILMFLVLLHSAISVVALVNGRISSQRIENFLTGWVFIVIVHLFFSLGIFFGVLFAWRSNEND